MATMCKHSARKRYRHVTALQAWVATAANWTALEVLHGGRLAVWAALVVGLLLAYFSAMGSQRLSLRVGAESRGPALVAGLPTLFGLLAMTTACWVAASSQVPVHVDPLAHAADKAVIATVLVVGYFSEQMLPVIVGRLKRWLSELIKDANGVSLSASLATTDADLS